MGRYLYFPLGCASRVLVGDIGRWVLVPGHRFPFFEKYANVKDIEYFGGHRMDFDGGGNAYDFEEILSTMSGKVLRFVVSGSLYKRRAYALVAGEYFIPTRNHERDPPFADFLWNGNVTMSILKANGTSSTRTRKP